MPRNNTTVEAFIEQWLQATAPNIRATTLLTYRLNLDRYVVPALGYMKLQDLNAATLQAFNATLLEWLAPKTVRNVHGILRRMLSDAVRWGLLKRNQSDAVDAPRRNTPEMKVWTPEQIRTFLRGVEGERLYPAWLLLCTTGMRRGEVLGLRWEDIDLDSARLSVRQARVSLGNEFVINEPKTRRGRRVVALDATTVAVLRSHRAAQAQERLAHGPDWNDSGLVFCKPDGSDLHPETLSRSFRYRIKRDGLPKIRLHDLRHSWASAALLAGVNAKVVSERLGHAQIAFTLDTYAHVLPSMDASAAETVAGAIFGT